MKNIPQESHPLPRAYTEVSILSRKKSRGAVRVLEYATAFLVAVGVLSIISAVILAIVIWG